MMSDNSQYKECEFCKNEIPILNFDLHGATCRRHHYKCPICGEFVSLSGKEEHEQMNHSSVRCEKCGTSYKPVDRETHVLVCRYADVMCHYCDSSVIRREFVEHQEACGARTERCENCGKYVMLKETQTHICRPPSPPDFTERIGTMFGSGSGQNSYIDLPFSNPYNIPREMPHNDTTRRAVPLVPFHMSPSPIEPPTFVSLSSLESRLPHDGDSNSTGVQLEFEPDPTGPCEFCGNQLPLSALDGHQELCKYRIYTTGTETKYCTDCKQMVPELEMAEHSLTCRQRSKPDKFSQPIGSHYSRRNKPEPKPDPRPEPIFEPGLEPRPEPGLEPRFEPRPEPRPEPIFESRLESRPRPEQRFEPRPEPRPRPEQRFEPRPEPRFEPRFEPRLEPRPELTPEDGSSMIPCEFCEQMCEFSEISAHQEICPNRNIPMEFGHILPPLSDTRGICEFCHKIFEDSEIENHRTYCTSNPLTGTETDTKCKYCLKKLSLERVERHQKICPKKYEEFVKKKCIWCLEHFNMELISNHEDTCSYRNVRGRRGIHDTELPLELPFSDAKPSPKIEQEKIGTIDNKCPFCRFPRPAFEMEKHKNICAKNPRFRSTSHFDTSPTPDELVKSSNPELGISSRLEPRPEPNKSKLRMHEKPAKSETLKNPFSKEPTYTHSTMDDNSRKKSDSKYASKHEPIKTTTPTTATTPAIHDTGSIQYSLYSKINPSPKLTFYKDKQQQTEGTKSPISSQSELFRIKNDREQQQYTHKQHEFTGKQQTQTARQQGTETKSPIVPIHGRSLPSPTELFQHRNDREQQQYTHKQQQNVAISPVFSSQASPTELFQHKNEREQQYKQQQQRQQYTHKQQHNDTTSPVFPSQTSPVELFQYKQQQQQQRQQYTHKQQHIDTTSPVFPSQTSPVDLFRDKPGRELAFSNMATDKGNLIFLPSKFKCDLKPPTVPLTNPLPSSRHTKPDSIILPDTSATKKHHLTPTQDMQMLFPLESQKLRSATVPSSTLPSTHYTDTNASYKPEPTTYNPRYTTHKQELTAHKPELSRKESPSQSKYPRHTSPRTEELDYPRKSDKYPDSNRSEVPSSYPRDRNTAARDIKYPPDYQQRVSYPRTSSTGTETIIDPPESMSVQKRTHDVSQRYKQTNNYHSNKY